MQFSFLLILVSFSEIFLVDVATSEVKLVAEFNNHVLGRVSFSQKDNGMVKISVGNLTVQGQYNMTIHQFPMKFIGPMSEVCQSKHIGNIFDPQSIMKALPVNDESVCKVNHSACAIGDLARKFGKLGKGDGNFDKNDSNLPLSGPESIFGRTLVIQNEIGNIACAPIRSPSPMKTLVGVFRAISPGIAGTIVLRQSQTNPNSETSVDIDLLLVDARSESKAGLSLAVHEGACSSIGNIFNPLAKTSCDKRQPSTCPIGDLSAKLGPIEVRLPGTGSSHLYFIDTNLPLSGKNSIAGRSLVISENGRPLICAPIQEYQVLEADVTFNDTQGLSGTIGLKQDSMYEPVMANVSVVQINGIYEHPLSAGSSCSISKLGNHWWNITGINQPIDGLTLYGPKSAMFRKLVFNKSGSSTPSCGTVVPINPTYHLKAIAHFTGTGRDAITGYVSLEQVTFNLSKAFTYFSSMILDLKYLADKTKKTLDHNWHFHLSPEHNNLKMRKCMSTKGHYNPYNVYVEGNKYTSTCDSSTAFRCELGDLSGKLGAYTIGSGMKQLTETENYLASWHNVIGRSVVIHAANRGAGRITCANLVPQSDASYSPETLLLRNSSATRDKDNFQKVVSEALGITAWRVADVKFHGVDGCLKYSFLLVDDTKSNLHKVFSNVVDDHPDKLKDFAPSCGSGDSNKWKINDGNAAEIVGLIFGIIALIVLIICIVFWLRKKQQDDEQKSKLVAAESGTAGNMGFSIDRDETGDAVDAHPDAEKEKEEMVGAVETYPNEESKKDDESVGKEWKLTTSL